MKTRTAKNSRTTRVKTATSKKNNQKKAQKKQVPIKATQSQRLHQTKKAVKIQKIKLSPSKPQKKIVSGCLKSNVLVDPHFHNHQNYSVLLDTKKQFNGKAFDCTMNQSDLKNNNNKFYIIQILIPDNGAQVFTLWNRWGRVGYDGQSTSVNFNNSEAAINAFKKKYEEK